MIIIDDPTPLTDALADTATTVLVLAGTIDGVAGAIHNFIETRPDMEPWRRWFLVTKLSALTPSQRSAWFGDENDRFVVLGGSVPKQLGPRGDIGELLRANRRPSVLRIRRVFAKGDEL